MNIVVPSLRSCLGRNPGVCGLRGDPCPSGSILLFLGTSLPFFKQGIRRANGKNKGRDTQEEVRRWARGLMVLGGQNTHQMLGKCPTRSTTGVPSRMDKGNGAEPAPPLMAPQLTQGEHGGGKQREVNLERVAKLCFPWVLQRHVESCQ